MDFAGNLDSCIALRTMVIKNGMAHVQAGGGIVADSTPIGEYQETLNKSRALLTALEAAHQSKGSATAVAARGGTKLK
jgi:anthranilate synthase component 1